eukprot:scaffold256523_cov15-Tisochrysis_lutea.AAC.1
MHPPVNVLLITALHIYELVSTAAASIARGAHTAAATAAAPQTAAALWATAGKCVQNGMLLLRHALRGHAGPELLLLGMKQALLLPARPIAGPPWHCWGGTGHAAGCGWDPLLLHILQDSSGLRKQRCSH